MSSVVSTATPELDNAVQLPAQNRASIATVLGVQALNSFSDNLVKLVLISLAFTVAHGTSLGDKMQVYLGIIFAVPYILFAPLAGYLSDRYSKKLVIFWMQAIQVLIFLSFLAVLWLRQSQWSLQLSLVCFFFLATQAAFFGPAKMGIMKELAGSRRLGMVSGWLQMSMMAAVLTGMGFGGFWFAYNLKKTGDAWNAALIPVAAVTVVAIIQALVALFIQATPEHKNLPFRKSLWWEHFSHLKLIFRVRSLTLSAMGIMFFWFLSNAVGTILIGLCNDLYPNHPAAAAETRSLMAGTLGVGVVLGSLIASVVCKRRIEMGLVPIAGFVLAASLLWAWIIPLGSNAIYVAMAVTGMGGGAFMVPLYAFVQDRAAPDERARVLAGIGLLDSIGVILGNGLVGVFLHYKLSSALQLGLFGLISIVAAFYITKLLPHSLAKIFLRSVTRTFYKVRAHYAERTPLEGPVLMLPNHVSFADALLLGVSCERNIRFVIYDTFYEMKAIQWGLRLFGTVPISPAKAKEAIRTVANALKENQAVCLFPEGQLTRTGYVNELMKGYELMARMGGNARVQPVWIDGIWGSILSYEGGRFFKKMPKLVPYKVTVWFGELMEARDANPIKMREAMLALSAEAFAARESLKKIPKLRYPDGTALSKDEAFIAHVNALRILETSFLLTSGDAIVCLLEPCHPMARTFALALPALHRLDVFWKIEDIIPRDEQRVIAIGDEAALRSIKGEPWDLAVLLVEKKEQDVPAVVWTVKDYPAMFDAQTGALLTMSVVDPVMPVGEEGLQVGRKAGSVGHLLRGISIRAEGPSYKLGGVIPGQELSVQLDNATLDDDGFVRRTA
ncbi:hypothetical protein BH11VER1_BH11VER1_00890 [soil metagenome]